MVDVLLLGIPVKAGRYIAIVPACTFAGCPGRDESSFP
jgi:hypothetical protein